MATVHSAVQPIPSSLRTFGLSWPLLVAVLTLLGLLANNRIASGMLADADTYWHIATARWIFEHGAVPHSDPFSHSALGAPWTAHEWLSEVMLGGVFEIAGWAGVVAVTALVFAGTLAYLTRFLLGRLEPVHALIFTVLAGSMMLSHLLARPHVLVWPLLTVWAGTLVNAAEGERLPPWGLLGVMALWANMHGSFLLGIALAGAMAVDAVLACPAGQRIAVARQWAGFLGLSLAAALATPAGVQGLWYPIEVMGMTVSLNTISEWRSPDFHQFQFLELWLLLLLAAACSGRVRLPWLRLLLVLGLVHLALRHQRNLETLALIAPLLMATPLAEQLRGTKDRKRDVEALDRLFFALAPPASPGAVAAGVLAAVLIVGTSLQFGRIAPRTERTPEAAVQAAASAGIAGPVLNSYAFGGYLVYRGIPVFIDGRADVYGDEFLKRYLTALGLNDPEALPKLLEDYRIEWTLLDPGTPAAALLDHLPGWRRLYADSIAVVHVRNGSRPGP